MTNQAARDAHRRADTLLAEAERRYPGVWPHMDRDRREPPIAWPDWCLLPMASAAGVTSAYSRPGSVADAVQPTAAVSALHAWRYARSVWLVEPGLMDRLLTQVPDTITVDDLTGLPEWCVFVAVEHPEWPGAGVWLHLEHDVNNGRPELRILIDLVEGGLDTLLPIPVYLDRDSVTEALADHRATAYGQLTRLAAGGAAAPGLDVRGGELDSVAARLAERVDGILALAAYLARPEADIVNADRPGIRPIKPRRPVRDRTTWMVGYST